MADHFDRLGVPVIIGEIAAFDKKNTPERVKFARLVSSECKRRGITLVWWMGLLDRTTVSWSVTPYTPPQRTPEELAACLKELRQHLLPPEAAETREDMLWGTGK